jgi:hypothetical protein
MTGASMDRDNAERLISYLEDAEGALQRALRAASGFPKDQRLEFSELLYQAIAALNSDVWKPIYDAYPDLAPEYESLEPPTIDSELTWDEVRLEPPLTAADVDDILFPLLRSDWQKVLRVLFNARDSCNIQRESFSYKVLAARLRDLADRNEIEGIGDLRMWGHSEVRLKH